MMSLLAVPRRPQAETGGLVSVSWRTVGTVGTKTSLLLTASSRAELNSVKTILIENNSEVLNKKIITG